MNAASRGLRVMSGVSGAVLFLAVWQIIGSRHIAGSGWPALTDVLLYLAQPARRGLFLRATAATLRSAMFGYLIGAVLGSLLAAAGQLVTRLRTGADRMSAWIHAIPMIALGPIFVLLLGLDAAPAAMAALGVLFTFYIGVTSGFAAVSPTNADLLTVLGAASRKRLILLSIPSAMPDIATAFKLSVPRAMIGAVLGEWFGAERGLGVLMVTAMQEAQIPLLWSAVLLVTVLSLSFFSVGSLIERLAMERFR